MTPRRLFGVTCFLAGLVIAMLSSLMLRARRAGRSLRPALSSHLVHTDHHASHGTLPASPAVAQAQAMPSVVSAVPSRLIIASSPSSPVLSRVHVAPPFAVPLDYDYSRSTRDNYSAKDGQSYGKYKAIRETLDKSYHGAYVIERQLMQDELVSQCVGTHMSRQTTPWIVFTAGAMGAGKSRTIKWMSKAGIFPLEDIVHIDPDNFKAALPEWYEYVARDPLKAGSHTHRESGYLVELAQEAALRLGMHVWVDGSLRDWRWYRRVFHDIRRRHPDYQIAILYVTADEEEVRRRVRKRAEATGRHVPEAELRDSLEHVPVSVNRLAPCAEFLAVIDNTEAVPHLTKYCEQEMCFLELDRWEEIEKRFRSVPLPPERAWRLRQLSLESFEDVRLAESAQAAAAAAVTGQWQETAKATGLRSRAVHGQCGGADGSAEDIDSA